MKPVLLLICICMVYSGAAQKFPADFTGRWQGTLQWHRGSNTPASMVDMRLSILPTDTAGQYTWQIQYGTQDTRPYLLKAMDTAKGHWIIDERDGLLLDAFWIGNRLSSSFSTGGTTIVNTHYLEGDRLVVEFYSYPAKPLSTTKSSNAEGTIVDSYHIRSFQRAVLLRNQ